MKLIPEVKTKWLAALRGGHYQQGRQQLRSEDNFCCLGVLCDLYQKETGLGEWDHNKYFDCGAGGDNRSDATLPAPVARWAFGDALAETMDPSIPADVVIDPEDNDQGDDTPVSLAQLNDGAGSRSVLQHDFIEIADLIEYNL